MPVGFGVVVFRAGASRPSVYPPDGLDGEIAGRGVPAPRLSRVGCPCQCCCKGGAKGEPVGLGLQEPVCSGVLYGEGFSVLRPLACWRGDKVTQGHGALTGEGAAFGGFVCPNGCPALEVLFEVTPVEDREPALRGDEYPFFARGGSDVLLEAGLDVGEPPLDRLVVSRCRGGGGLARCQGDLSG